MASLHCVWVFGLILVRVHASSLWTCGEVYEQILNILSVVVVVAIFVLHVRYQFFCVWF